MGVEPGRGELVGGHNAEHREYDDEEDEEIARHVVLLLVLAFTATCHVWCWLCGGGCGRRAFVSEEYTTTRDGVA